MVNVLEIVIDDMPIDMLQTMPFTKAEIRDKGAIYPNGTIMTPLCGPSRATLFTGLFTHNHGEWANSGTNGGWSMLQPWEANALPVAMQNAGFRTGLFGKYTNGWIRNWWKANKTPPPGWDRFKAIDPDTGGDGDYYNYTLVGTGADEPHGALEADYSTDVVSAKAAQFISNTPDDQPFFCYYAPYGSHANYTPAPRHVGTYNLDDAELNPGINSDNSLRAPWLRSLPLVDLDKIRNIYTKQHECLASVDEGIAQIFAAIGPTRLADTLILFTGDNGLQRGEQRLNGKNVGYPASINVTMMARHDGVITAGTKPQELVVNADFTKQIVDAAGATMYALDGLPLGTRTSGILLEGMEGEPDNHPGFIGWKTRNWLYLNWGAGQGEELYKIICDKHAINNVAATYPDKVLEFRQKAIAAANPLPPGFVL